MAAALPKFNFKTQEELKIFMDNQAAAFNNLTFITNDPISIPHKFSKMQDVEISGFFAAILAWGQRKTIINKMNDLLSRMDNDPHNFILYHKESDLKSLIGFKHRTFNDTDLLYFISFFKFHYSNFNSLEQAFIPENREFDTTYSNGFISQEIKHSSPVCYLKNVDFNIEMALNHFRSYFFSLDDYPARTKKHISSPLQKSTCKRLNMFLRWMIRKDTNGVDFGIWDAFNPSQLICPCDVHVDRVARHLGLIKRKQTDWLTAVELTQNLRKLDSHDPVKYDFALFGMGVAMNTTS